MDTSAKYRIKEDTLLSKAGTVVLLDKVKATGAEIRGKTGMVMVNHSGVGSYFVPESNLEMID